MFDYKNKYRVVRKAISIVLICLFSIDSVAFANQDTLAPIVGNPKAYQAMRSMMEERLDAHQNPIDEFIKQNSSKAKSISAVPYLEEEFTRSIAACGAKNMLNRLKTTLTSAGGKIQVIFVKNEAELPVFGGEKVWGHADAYVTVFALEGEKYLKEGRRKIIARLFHEIRARSTRAKEIFDEEFENNTPITPEDIAAFVGSARKRFEEDNLLIQQEIEQSNRIINPLLAKEFASLIFAVHPDVMNIDYAMTKKTVALTPLLLPELIDVLDSVTGKPTGVVKTKEQIHKDGDAHASSIILVFDSEGRFLRQKRSARVSTDNGKFDVSTVGHLKSGEDYLRCAVRELGEELDINPAEDDLLRVGPEGGYRSRGNEVNTIYLYFKPDEVQVTPDPVEVESVDWIGLEELRADYGKRTRAYYSGAISDICDNEKLFAEIARLVRDRAKPERDHERPKFQGSPYAVALVLTLHKEPMTVQKITEETKKAESTIERDLAVLKKGGFAIEDYAGAYLVNPNLSPAKVTEMLDVLKEEYASGQITKKRGNDEAKFIIERLKEIESFDAEGMLSAFGSDAGSMKEAVKKMIQKNTLEKFRKVVNRKVSDKSKRAVIIELIDKRLEEVGKMDFRARHIRELNNPASIKNNKFLIPPTVRRREDIQPQREIPSRVEKREPLHFAGRDMKKEGPRVAVKEVDSSILDRFKRGEVRRWSETTEEERVCLINKLAEFCKKKPGELMPSDFTIEFPEFRSRELNGLLTWYMKKEDLLNLDLTLRWIKENVLRVENLFDSRNIGVDQLGSFFYPPVGKRPVMPAMSRVTKEAKLYMLECLARHLSKRVDELEPDDFKVPVPEFNNLDLSRMIAWTKVEFAINKKKSAVKAILDHLGIRPAPSEKVTVGSLPGVFKYLCDNNIVEASGGVIGQTIAKDEDIDRSPGTIDYDLRGLYNLKLIQRPEEDNQKAVKDSRWYVPENIKKKRDQLMPILAQFKGKNLRPDKTLLDQVYEEEIRPILEPSVDDIKGNLVGLEDIDSFLGIPHYNARWHREGGIHATLKDHLQEVLTCLNSIVDGSSSAGSGYPDLMNLVKDQAKEHRDELEAAILTHDLGKQKTGEIHDGRWAFPGHEEASYKLIREKSLTYKGKPISESVIVAAKYHDMHWRINYSQSDEFENLMQSMRKDFNGPEEDFRQAVEFTIALSVIDTLGGIVEGDRRRDLESVKQFADHFEKWRTRKHASSSDFPKKTAEVSGGFHNYTEAFELGQFFRSAGATEMAVKVLENRLENPYIKNTDVIKEYEMQRELVKDPVALDVLNQLLGRIDSVLDESLIEILPWEELDPRELAIRTERFKRSLYPESGELPTMLNGLNALLARYSNPYAVELKEVVAQSLDNYGALFSSENEIFKEHEYDLRSDSSAPSLTSAQKGFLRQLNDATGALAASAALSTLRVEHGYKEAAFTKDGPLFTMQEAIHPTIEIKGNFEPVSFTVPGEGRAVLVSGLNTGGKSVTLKTAGIIALMAQCGIPVPADVTMDERMFTGFVKPHISRDDANIGKASRFAAELAASGRLLEALAPRTLAIIDDDMFGGSSEPAIAASCFSATVEGLSERRASVVAVTHHIDALEALRSRHPDYVFKRIKTIPGKDGADVSTRSLEDGIAGSSKGLDEAVRQKWPAAAGAVAFYNMLRKARGETELSYQGVIQPLSDKPARYRGVFYTKAEQANLQTDRFADVIFNVAYETLNRGCAYSAKEFASLMMRTPEARDASAWRASIEKLKASPDVLRLLDEKLCANMTEWKQEENNPAVKRFLDLVEFTAKSDIPLISENGRAVKAFIDDGRASADFMSSVEAYGLEDALYKIEAERGGPEKLAKVAIRNNIRALFCISPLAHMSWPFASSNDKRGRIHINGGWHSILTKDLLRTPNDVIIDINGPSEREGSLTIYTGFNTGGKSTLVKMIAEIVTLARMGWPVPASSADIGEFSDIQVVSGMFTEDKQQSRLHRRKDAIGGALAAALHESALVLKSATPKTLVILDEPFSGCTEPSVSAALTAALAEGLVKKGATVILVTHLLESVPLLTARIPHAKTFKAKTAEIDGLTVPLYHFEPGTALSSHGFEVAKGMKWPGYERALSYFELLSKEAQTAASRHSQNAAGKATKIKAIPNWWLSKKNMGGVLCPLFSGKRQGDQGIGDLKWLEYFIDFMSKQDADFIVQLPTTQINSTDPCPYVGISLFANNAAGYLPLDEFISAEELSNYKERFVKMVEEGSLGEKLAKDIRSRIDLAPSAKKIDYAVVIPYKEYCLRQEFEKVYAEIARGENREFNTYVEENKDWIEDYALFHSLLGHNGGKAWWEWDRQYKERDAETLKAYSRENKKDLLFYQYIQWLYYSRWQKTRAHAREKGKSIIGDVPIYPAPNSADVWANQDIFDMTKNAGAPSEPIAPDGQNWGTHPYRWDAKYDKALNFWEKRIRYMAKFYDGLRIDHLLGLCSEWLIDIGQHPNTGKFYPESPEEGAARGEQILRYLAKVAEEENILLIGEDIGDRPQVIRDMLDRLSLELPNLYLYNPVGWRQKHMANRPHTMVVDATHDTPSTMAERYPGFNDGDRNQVRDFLSAHDIQPTSDAADDMEEQVIKAMKKENFYCLTLQTLTGERSAQINIPGTVGPHNWTWRSQEVESLLGMENLGYFPKPVSGAKDSVKEISVRLAKLQTIKDKNPDDMTEDDKQYLAKMVGYFKLHPEYLLEFLTDNEKMHRNAQTLFILTSAELASIDSPDVPEFTLSAVDEISDGFFAHELSHIFDDTTVFYQAFFRNDKWQTSQHPDIQKELNRIERVFPGKYRGENMGWRLILSQWKGLGLLSPRIILVLVDRLERHMEEIALARAEIMRYIRDHRDEIGEEIVSKYLKAAERVDGECRVNLTRLGAVRQDLLRSSENTLVDVGESIRQALQPYKGNDRLEVQLQLASSTPPIYGNAVKVSYIWTNLFRNGVDAMFAKTKKNLLFVKTQSVVNEGKEFVEVAVSDNGMGISEDLLQNGRLFQKGMTTKMSGNGLGLYLIKQTVEELGGTIDVQSEVGKGTTFTILLPAVTSSDPRPLVTSATDALSALPQEWRENELKSDEIIAELSGLLQIENIIKQDKLIFPRISGHKEELVIA